MLCCSSGRQSAGISVLTAMRMDLSAVRVGQVRLGQSAMNLLGGSRLQPLDHTYLRYVALGKARFHLQIATTEDGLCRTRESKYQKQSSVLRKFEVLPF